jgi:hypothetical protein
MPTTAESVRALAAPAGDVGGRWMLHREVIGQCRSFGYPNAYAYYVAGRGGVLGDVDADVVGSAFGFFEPALLRKMWEAGVAVEGARNAASRYGAACAQWGRSRLVGFDGCGRMAELIRHVVDSADAAGLPLFAGWRAEPRPDDLAGQAYAAVNLLRELRGSAHIAAVVATGIAPRDAMLLSGGEPRAQQFGWVGPFPDLAHLVELRAETEALTDQIMTRFFDQALNAVEAAELLELTLAMKGHLDSSR